VLVTGVVSPVSSRESWTVVGDDDRTVEPVELYLAYLTGVERSPNTVKAYAHDLRTGSNSSPTASWIGGQ
jgi:integrase/recombinase XerD